MAKISLVAALYNAEKYLRDCLDSVAAQTFTDFECLCINDGSTDKTAEIVQEYVDKDPRFKLINQKNSGCSVARNTGIDNASAPYLALLDQDDVLHPQAFECLYYLIKKYKTDAATFKFKTVGDDFKMGKVEHYDFSEVEAKVSNTPFEDFYSRKKGSQVEVWTRLYDMKAIKGIYFPPNVQPAEDTVFTLKVMHRIKSIVHVDTELLFYRDSSTSVMNEGKTEKYVRSHILAARVLYDYFIKEEKLQGKELKWMRYYISRIVFKACISQVLRRGKDNKLRILARELVKDLYERKIFIPQTQGFRKCLASKLFIRGWYKLARTLC